ncbi:MAG: restriction endonuclease [Sphingomonadales bacterium]|nr:restriction endonuclease [Sphingomonadales bacterium]MBU3992933.1 restriction endonuclease [Alphaproteobacteria bacterium]
MEFFASVDLDVEAIGVEEAIDVVSEQLSSYDDQDREVGFNPSNLPFDGHAFESWVANALNAFGWDASVTVASGDQGIDVIAKRGGQKLGIQCKLYSRAIGNKAVQEAHAGKSYHGVNKVAVLSNSEFTRSARDLASVTGVVLCSHHDIPHLYDKVFGK